MKTSLGIWALGPMVTRFVPGGYQPAWREEPMAEKVHRAVAGLGDLMDDYEFHYPGELNRDNLDEVRAALDGHGIYCIASGLHVDPRFGKGGLTALDDSVRAEAIRICLEAADLAGGVGAQMIVWPGGEGYNYPFQVPYAEVWARLLDGLAEIAERLAQHDRLHFLQHQNSEPAMKIHMSNIGMTLHVIH
jgi:xylose isomerase